MKIGIIGGAESGVGAALLAKKMGDDPIVSEYQTIAESDKIKLKEYKIRFEESGHSFEILSTCDLIVKSPGISNKVPIVRSLLDQGIKVISELEYAFRNKKRGAIIAITGSNGKTTCTNLVHHLLETGGVNAVKGGNLGTCFSNLLLEKQAEIYVLEVSSFQLDDISSFRPDVAILLNITADHLDRYEYDIYKYAASKLRLIEFQTKNDLFLYYDSDPISSELVKKITQIKPEVIALSESRMSFDDFNVSNDYLRGDHNRINASFAIDVARRMSISEALIYTGLRSFKNDDHRLQTVVRLDEVEWINDSKATNVDSCFYALKAIDGPIVWIAGGIDKGNDYSKLYDLFETKVKVLICLGTENQKLREAFERFGKPILEAESMSEALDKANRIASSGDQVLLSPACASFDLFRNYKDRGEQFIKGVWNLMRKANE